MARSIHILDHQLVGIRHICCFYDSEEQLQQVFGPYLREGLSSSEQVVCIFPKGHHPGLRKGIDGNGIDLAAATARRQFQLLDEDETYISGGLFSKDRMAQMLRDLLDAAAQSEFQKVRTLGEMSWVLKHLPGTDDLVDYEHIVNELCHQYDCTLACAYDLARFDGATVADALSTHSHVVLNGRIFENPHFMQPADFKRFMSRRKSGPGRIRARTLSQLM